MSTIGKLRALRDQYKSYIDNPDKEGHIGPLFTHGVITQARATVDDLDTIINAHDADLDALIDKLTNTAYEYSRRERKFMEVAIRKALE